VLIQFTVCRDTDREYMQNKNKKISKRNFRVRRWEIVLIGDASSQLENSREINKGLIGL
jgi:hypothetical protein